ncbi:MAG: hypothetical protein ACQSGP_24830 [Frankia sp.]
MIWFTGRQFRTPAMVAGGALAIAAVILAITGPHLVHVYDTAVATCAANGNCPTVTTAFLRLDRTLRVWLGILVLVLPGIVGVFWGAPLVAREVEDGTFRLAWTQSVTRTRWLAVKLGVVGAAAVAATGLLSLMVTWWASPLDRVTQNRFGTFGQRDLVPLGYAAFAFALGATIGALLRRTLPAMATTLVAFVAARLAATSWLRPRLIAPAHQTLALDPNSTGFGSSVSGLAGIIGGHGPTASLQPGTPNIPGAWIYSTRIVNRQGRSLTSQVLTKDCPSLGGNGPRPSGSAARGPVPGDVQQALHDCVTKVGVNYHELVSYQPASRYWTFQWYETAIFMAAALILGGVCHWVVRRRIP